MSETEPNNLPPEEIESTTEKESEYIIETVQRGAQYFASDVLVRDTDNRLAKVISFDFVTDNTRYGREDPSIRRPKKLVNPIITIRYPDDQESKIGTGNPLTAVYANTLTAKISEDEPYFEESHLETRGHDYQLGELVSFGNQIGTLMIIYPDHQTVVISAREVWGKETPYHLYKIGVDKIDYIERDNGSIRKKTDGTVFKPTHDS